MAGPHTAVVGGANGRFKTGSQATKRPIWVSAVMRSMPEWPKTNVSGKTAQPSRKVMLSSTAVFLVQ